MVTPSDAELVACGLKGDEIALRTLVQRYERMVLGLCHRMLSHRQDAEDAAQDVFVRAFRSLRRWDCHRPLRPWLLAIAANRCRTILAQRGRRQALVRLVHRLPDPEVPATSGDLAEEIQRALDRLPAKQRLAFVLFHEQDLGCAEVAAVLRCPEGTVKTWLHRARRQIADDLQRRGVVPEARYALR